MCGKQFKNKYKKLAQNVAAMGRMNDREGNMGGDEERRAERGRRLKIKEHLEAARAE